MHSSSRVAPILDHLIRGEESALLQELDAIEWNDPLFSVLFRSAAFHASKSPLYFRRLLNLWCRHGCPPLKPATREIAIEVLADTTMNGLEPFLKLFCAPYGLNVSVMFGDFDAVEQQAFAASENSAPAITLVVLSDYWLQRQFATALPSRSQIQDAEGLLNSIIEGLMLRRRGHLIFTSLSPGAFPPPSSSLSTRDRLGWTLAIAELNLFLASRTNSRVHLLDTAAAIQLAGGNAALGCRSYFRARAPLEEPGLIALAREAATGIAQLMGKSHRVLLTDWDNTLWEGEVGEVGIQGIVCGQDSPDALSYYLLQVYLRNLQQQGVLLAAVSRNDPAIARVLDENVDLALRREHFACLALSWGNKSDSIASVQSQLRFGTEFMLYMDDNPVDLAEALTVFPHLDLLPAGPTPEITLSRLINARFFNALSLTEEDLERPQRVIALAEQERAVSAASSREEFLRSLQLRLYVRDLVPENSERVLQLLQKTNQFNLTTRRHTESDLISLRAQGARFGVFRYVDRFGPQGIIGLVILVPQNGSLNIDTWLMSCRVLNRNVENAMFQWILQHAAGASVTGVYIPTEKNALVKGLYLSLGFEQASCREPAVFIYRQSPQADLSLSMELIYE